MGDDLGQRFVRWTQKEPSISAVVMIGSRVRRTDDVGRADNDSDWDFQIVTSQPARFEKPAWTRVAGFSEPLAYVVRGGRLGQVAKVSVVFPEGELDIVLIPTGQLWMVRLLFTLGLIKHVPRADAAIIDLSTVLRPGHRLLKGAKGWELFFDRLVSDVPSRRLTNAAAIDLAEGFVCDYISCAKKIRRGEYLAAQRWMHVHLVETNFCLLHELKQRSGERSFPDARRLETTTSVAWREAVAVRAVPDHRSMSDALEHCAQACRDLMQALVGTTWCWPDLPLRLGGEKF